MEQEDELNVVQCKYCGKNVKDVGPTFFVDSDDMSISCADCGVAPAKTSPPQGQQDASTATPEGPPLDLSCVNRAIQEVLWEKFRSMAKYNYTDESDSRQSICDFLLTIRRHLTAAEILATSHDPQARANSRRQLVKMVVLGLAYLGTHPIPNEI